MCSPLSQGKPIEWKLGTEIIPPLVAILTPLSQGKPIEWKPLSGDPIVKIPPGLPSRRGNQLNGNTIHARFSGLTDCIPPLSQGKPIEWKLGFLWRFFPATLLASPLAGETN